VRTTNRDVIKMGRKKKDKATKEGKKEKKTWE
jgi:hypothetical protein